MHVSPVAGDGRPPAVDVGGRRGRGTPTASGNKWQPGIAFSRKAQRTWRPRGRPLILCSAALMTGLPLESAKRAARPFLRGSRTAPPHRRRGGWAPLPPALIPFHFASSSLSPPSPVSTCSIAFSSHHHHTTPRLSPPETRPLLDDVLAKPPPSPLAEGGCVLSFIGAATAKASRSISPTAAPPFGWFRALAARVGSELRAAAPPRYGERSFCLLLHRDLFVLCMLACLDSDNRYRPWKG
jgi:hypothetical protein